MAEPIIEGNPEPVPAMRRHAAVDRNYLLAATAIAPPELRAFLQAPAQEPPSSEANEP